ncbi:hypothetical protein LWI29_021494 [Acer saccharum]|uniref:RNase H type-1 domain-containing protein n=1 Tax=Acer saccharum TaxID=4024 RepID=A0AA39W6Q6_ACESA|nr:hypothetical protein LWI29_021494 [Acer saccharum]
MHFHDFMLNCLRNQLVHNLGTDDYGDVLGWASNFFEEWNSVHVVNNPSFVSASNIHGWRPPEGAAWKINLDATMDYARGVIGLGIIIRDKVGKVFLATAVKVRAMFSPIVAEAMAVWRGVGLAIEAGLVPFQIDSDCLQFVDMFVKACPPLRRLVLSST